MPLTSEQREQFIADIRNNNYQFIPAMSGQETAIRKYNHARTQLIAYLSTEGLSHTDKILAIYRFYEQQHQTLVDLYSNASRNVEKAVTTVIRERYRHLKTLTGTILKTSRQFLAWATTILSLSTLTDEPSVISRDISEEKPSLAMSYEAASQVIRENEADLIVAGRGISLHPRLQAEMLDPKHRAWGTRFVTTWRVLNPLYDAWVNEHPRREDLTVAIEFNDKWRLIDRSFDPNINRENMDPDDPQCFNSFNHYLTPKESLDFLLTSKDGLLYRGTDTEIIQNTGKYPHIFVMDMQGNFYSNHDGQYLNGRRIGHPSFTQGKPIAGAGEIKIIAGKITEISNLSGHYIPGPLSLRRVLDALEARGVLAVNCQVKIIPPPGQHEGLFTGTVKEFKATYPLPAEILNAPDLSEKANPAVLLSRLKAINDYLKQRAGETNGFLALFNSFNGKDFYERSSHFNKLMIKMMTKNREEVLNDIEQELKQFQRGRRTTYANLLCDLRDALTEDSLLTNSLVGEYLHDYLKIYERLNLQIKAQHAYCEMSFFSNRNIQRGEIAHGLAQYKFLRKEVSKERRSEFAKDYAVAEMAKHNAKNW